MKERMEIDTAHVLYAMALKYVRVDHVAWKVLVPTQPNPTVSSARVNKYPCVIYIT